MRRDDVKDALDALASEVPAPRRDRNDVVARGRRRRLQRRVALVGVAGVLVAAVAAVGTLARASHTTTIGSHTPAATTPITAPATGPAVGRSSVFPSSLEAWKCGNPLRYTSDGGKRWRDVVLPAAVPVAGGECSAVPGGNAWMSWPNGNAGDWYLLRIRGLDDMSVFSLPAVPREMVFGSPTFIDRDHGWFTVRAAGGATTLYRTLDGGATWERASSGQPLGPMAFANADDGWATHGRKRTLLATTDGGTSWKQVVTPVPAGDVARFQVVAHGDFVVVWSGTHITGSQYRTFFDVSDDGGRTWALRNGPAGFELPTGAENYFSATDATHWQLVSGPELRVTADGGRTWQTRPDLPLAKNENLEFPISFPTVDVGWIITAQGKMLRTSDGGYTWADVTRNR